MSDTYRVGVDIGGTFTDIIFVNQDGAMFVKKVLSTPDDYSGAVMTGFEKAFAGAGLNASSIKEVIHATTVATNACLERKGAKTGLITTKGFRDVLEMGRGRMPVMYDVSWCKTAPLVPRYLRLEVDERIDARGGVVRPLDIGEAIEAIQKLLAYGVEAVAVCLLNSPHNPVHELRIGQLLRENAPNVYVSLSTQVRPLIKEYERTSETVVNAYCMPVVSRYLKSFKSSLEEIGVKAHLFVMQSNGGVMTVEACMDKPVEMIESGPAAGVVGAAYLVNKLGYGNAITLDIGGTTCKASLIENGRYAQSAEFEVGAGINIASQLLTGKGYVLRVPSIYLAEIGAGGGSILRVDGGGALHVGPESAGAVPGPACYGLGGDLPTLTDAYAVMGYFDVESSLGGELKLDLESAYRVVQGKIAKPLGVGVPEAAHAAFRIASSSMMRAVSAISSERGRDPRECVLVVFGGAGPIHGAELARALGSKRVIVPPYAGLFSAIGLLCTDIEYYSDRMFTCVFDDSGRAFGDLNRIFAELIAEAMSSARTWGYAGAEVERLVDCRYVGQTSTLTVPVPPGEIGPEQMLDVAKGFEKEHEKTFGYRMPELSVESLNIRLKARIPLQGLSLFGGAPVVDQAGSSDRRHSLVRQVYFGADHGWLETAVLGPKDLGQIRTTGPLIIDAFDSTIVVPPGYEVSRGELGAIVIDRVG